MQKYGLYYMIKSMRDSSAILDLIMLRTLTTKQITKFSNNTYLVSCTKNIKKCNHDEKVSKYRYYNRYAYIYDTFTLIIQQQIACIFPMYFKSNGY